LIEQAETEGTKVNNYALAKQVGIEVSQLHSSTAVNYYQCCKILELRRELIWLKQKKI